MLRLVALGCLVAALVVAAVALVDHRHKLSVQNAAQVEAWFCAHGRPARCQDFDPSAHERHWERRELVYKTGFVALGASAFVLGAAAFRRRPRTEET